MGFISPDFTGLTLEWAVHLMSMEMIKCLQGVISLFLSGRIRQVRWIVFLKVLTSIIIFIGQDLGSQCLEPSEMP